MGWSSIFIGSQTSRDFVKNYHENSKSRIIKSVQKGTKFYSLMETEAKNQWIWLTIARKNKGEIYYKDIQCNPYEDGVPLSLLKKFIPSTNEDKIWLKQQLEKVSAEKKAPNFKIGDFVKCTSFCDIRYTDGFSIRKGVEFYITIEKNFRTNRRQYLVYRARDNSYYRSMYSIPPRLFKSLKKELVEKR